MEPYLPHPEGHLVGVGRAMVQVQVHHAEDDREGDQDHGEHEVFDDDGDRQGCLWDFISQQEKKHRQGEEGEDGESHLLP